MPPLRMLLAAWLFGALACSPSAVERPGAAVGRSGPAPASDQAKPVAPAAQPTPDEQPPSPGITPDAQPLNIEKSQLARGLAIHVAYGPGMPLASINLVVQSGSAADGPHPGLARMTAELMKEGGAGQWFASKLADRLGALGTDLVIQTTHDATRFSMLVTSDRLDPALKVLAAVARRPRLSLPAFSRVRQRQLERTRNLVSTNGKWPALLVLHRELYDLPTATHPYAAFAATPDDLNRVHFGDCQRWHRTHVTPNNSFLVVAGDVAKKTVIESAEKAFRGWKGERPSAPTFTDPLPPMRPSVHLVDYPKSKQSHILVGALGPAPRSEDFPPIGVAMHLLAGGTGGRLPLELVQRRSLADAAGSRLLTVARGPTPIVLSARSPITKTALATEALLEQFVRVGSEVPSEEETQAAARQLAGLSLTKRESAQGLAQLAVVLGLRGLPRDHFRQQREIWKGLTPQALHAAAKRYFLPDRVVIVVTGDASRVSKALSHFGKVSVLDPTKGFVVKKSLPHDPSASLAIPESKKK